MSKGTAYEAMGRIAELYLKLRAVGEAIGRDASLRFTYTNHRGGTAERVATPQGLYWGSTEYHPEPQWLMASYTARGPRDFAVKEMEDIREC